MGRERLYRVGVFGVYDPSVPVRRDLVHSTGVRD